MQLIVRGQSTHVLECKVTQCIAEIKDEIAALENLYGKDVCLYAQGRPLKDNFIIGDIGVNEIELCVGLRGGSKIKFNASSLLVGKVRNQTPKVEKQAKRKQKTGRAKKRIGTNKGFAGVIITNRGPL